MVLAVQALAAVFFIADVGQDLLWGGLNPHSVLEAIVALALIIGTSFGAMQMRQLLNRIRQAETAMSVASHRSCKSAASRLPACSTRRSGCGVISSFAMVLWVPLQKLT